MVLKEKKKEEKKPRESIIKKYIDTVEYAEIKIKPQVILLLTVVGTAVGAVIGSFFDITLSFLIAVLVFDAGVGVPFYLADRKKMQIEDRLPDVLHHMGTTLKTGGTIEVALREVSRIDYGPITKGLKDMLREINEGKTFEMAFSDFAVKSKSDTMQKSAIIIIAARKSGGALLDTLTAMAEDIRAIYRLKRERKTKTFMQYLFIIVSGSMVAPFVFGIVKSVLEILVRVGGSATAETTAIVTEFDTLFKMYLILESALAVMGAVQVREGKWTKATIYIPVAVLITYIIYTFISVSFVSLLGGK